MQPQMFVAATWPPQTWTLPLHDVDQLQPVASLELRPGPLVVLYSHVKRVVIFAVDSKHIRIRFIYYYHYCCCCYCYMFL